MEGSSPWALKAVWISLAQPCRSATLAGSNRRSSARTLAGERVGPWELGVRLQPASTRAAARAVQPRNRDRVGKARTDGTVAADTATPGDSFGGFDHVSGQTAALND